MMMMRIFVTPLRMTDVNGERKVLIKSRSEIRDMPITCILDAQWHIFETAKIFPEGWVINAL